MKKLILTEKPSVARDFAAALGITSKSDGFIEGDEYVITWAIGHLLELKAPGEYDAKWKRWSLDSLPILPDRLGYKSVSKTRKQLSVIKKQLKRKDIAEVIVATDAGREGELIARTLIEAAKPKAALKRFWTSQALSKAVILEELNHLKPLAEYDRLYLAGRSRQSADWLVGMNLSRLATIRLGDLFSIGRVQTAVLALLVKRNEEIKNFKPEKYFHVTAKLKFNDDLLQALWFDPKAKQDKSKIAEKSAATAIVDRCRNADVVVSTVTKNEKSVPSPMLFSLTELQKVANQRYGFSAKKTLGVAQALYEKHKCLSYPRTDAKVLGSKSFSQVNSLLKLFAKTHRDLYKQIDVKKVSLSNRLVFNDAKLTDHHALIPLKPFKGPQTSDEARVFELVLKRFLAAFSKNHVYEDTEIVCVAEQEHFKSKGKRTICEGWKYLLGSDKDSVLPAIEEKQKGSVKEIKAEDKETKPPPLYNEATLLNDMMNPARLVAEKKFKAIFKGDVGLGTQATRAQIIETLLNRKYIKREKRFLAVQDKGIALVDTLNDLKLSSVLTCPEETAKWELELDQIAQGEGDARKFMLAIREFVANCTGEWKGADDKVMQRDFVKSKTTRKGRKKPPKAGEKIGACPVCQKDVVEYPKNFGCTGWQEGCKFTVWKKIAGKEITIKNAKMIIESGSTEKLTGFMSKAGKPFDAKLSLRDGQVKFV